jgi:hypothetical protein
MAARSKSWWPGWLGLHSPHPLLRSSHSFNNSTGYERRSSGGMLSSPHLSSSSGLLADAEQGGLSGGGQGRSTHRAHRGRWVVGGPWFVRQFSACARLLLVLRQWVRMLACVVSVLGCMSVSQETQAHTTPLSALLSCWLAVAVLTRTPGCWKPSLPQQAGHTPTALAQPSRCAPACCCWCCCC